MPDIPNRAELEAKLHRALNKLRGDQLARLRAYLGNPPDVANVPDKFWKEIEDDDRELLLLLLLPLAIKGAETVASLVGLELSKDKMEALVRKQIEGRAAQVAKDSAKNTKSGLKDLIDRLNDRAKGGDGDSLEIPQGDIDDGLEILLGDARNENQAITETTQANSLGEIAARDEAEKQGKIVQVEWRTELDSKVCPVCRPLNGRPEADWVELFPDGPPAHPRCRCWMHIEGKDVGTDETRKRPRA